MKTFVNLCKKPLLLVSAVLFVVFTALLVVSFIMPLGNKYSAKVNLKDTMGASAPDFTISQSITLGKDGKAKMGIKLDEKAYKNAMKELLGDLYNEENIDKSIEAMNEAANEELSYKKEDGKVIINSFATFEIKGYKLVMPASTEKTPDFVCTANTAVQTVSIVLMVVSGLALAGCVVVTLLDKKGVFDKKSEAAAE